MVFLREMMMSEDLEVFHPDRERAGFEARGRDNGFRHWMASDLVDLLEYASMHPVIQAVNRAMLACNQLGIHLDDNFVPVKTPDGGKDYKLSRFACYLTVMNGDPKKRRVAEAQAYFATMAEACRRHQQETEAVERVAIRGEVSDGEKSLSATAGARGVQNFALFQNAGYRGLYNMDLWQLRSRKAVPEGRSPLDFMGKTELAANLFRITQTDERIKAHNVRGEQRLRGEAEAVGKAVRETMRQISGVRPEDLPAAEDIKQVRAGLKRAGRELRAIDVQKPGSKR